MFTLKNNLIILLVISNIKLILLLFKNKYYEKFTIDPETEAFITQKLDERFDSMGESFKNMGEIAKSITDGNDLTIPGNVNIHGKISSRNLKSFLGRINYTLSESTDWEVLNSVFHDKPENVGTSYMAQSVIILKHIGISNTKIKFMYVAKDNNDIIISNNNIHFEINGKEKDYIEYIPLLDNINVPSGYKNFKLELLGFSNTTGPVIVRENTYFGSLV